jgi:hypothetical protein
MKEILLKKQVRVFGKNQIKTIRLINPTDETLNKYLRLGYKIESVSEVNDIILVIEQNNIVTNYKKTSLDKIENDISEFIRENGVTVVQGTLVTKTGEKYNFNTYNELLTLIKMNNMAIQKIIFKLRHVAGSNNDNNIQDNQQIYYIKLDEKILPVRFPQSVFFPIQVMYLFDIKKEQ